MSGRLVRPSDPAYSTSLQLYDSRFDSVMPQGIAYCSTSSDVQRCLAFAMNHGLPFSARSGGHSYAGYSTSTGLVIDVTAMSGVAVGAAASGPTATIGAGARLIDVYTALNAQGVSIPGGSCPTVGIAGLTLGGGAGVVDRAYGMTCDFLTSVELVTADGQLTTASRASNADLFWACQGGGGGNFGIATSFTFKTFATTSPTLVFLKWPWAAAADVLAAWLAWAPSAPDQLWSNCLLEASPGSASPLLQVGVVWIGDPSGLAGPLDQLLAAVGTAPSSRYSETVAFGHAMYVEGGCASLSQASCHLPTQNPGGTLTRQPSLAKSAYVSSPLGDAGVQVVVDAVQSRQSQNLQGAAGFDAYGGAINRVPAAATAFVHRNTMASVQLNVPFSPGTASSELAASEAFLNSWYGNLQPHLDGQAYQNYIDPDLANWADAYYGANLPRLRQVKRKWDPDHVFRFAQSIPV